MRLTKKVFRARLWFLEQGVYKEFVGSPMGRKRENTVHDGRYMTTVHEVVVAAAGSFKKKELRKIKLEMTQADLAGRSVHAS